MIKEFKVKKFRSFNDWISIKFDDVRDYGFKKECIKNGLINKALIYGENSSGKSNLGFAIMDISTHLFDGNNILLPYDNFLNLNSTENEASFVYVFKFDDDIIEYSYQKDSYRKLIFEKIKQNGNLIFEYNYLNKKVFNRIEDINTLKFENNTSNISMVKFIYNNSDLSEKSPIKRIMDFALNMLWFRSVRNFEYKSKYVIEENINNFIIRNNLVEELEKFFLDNNLNYKLGRYNNLGKEIIVVNYENGAAPLMEVASSGTMSLLLFFYLMHKKNNISFLFIDEFDTFYHYDVSKNILLNVIKNQNFQAILTTQNTFLCDNNIMRPDCYFIIKNNLIKSLSNWTKKDIRQGHNLEKMMISGEFDK